MTCCLFSRIFSQMSCQLNKDIMSCSIIRGGLNYCPLIAALQAAFADASVILSQAEESVFPDFSSIILSTPSIIDERSVNLTLEGGVNLDASATQSLQL